MFNNKCLLNDKLTYLPADKDFQRFEGVGCHNPRSNAEHDLVSKNWSLWKTLENQNQPAINYFPLPKNTVCS